MKVDFSYLNYILGSLDDPEMDLYELTKIRLGQQGLDVLIRMPDYFLRPRYTFKDLIREAFYLDEANDQVFNVRSMRNNLRKPWLFSDETYEVKIWFEQKLLWQEVLVKGQWTQTWETQELNTLTAQLSWWEKVRLYQFGVLHLQVRAVESGEHRLTLEQAGCFHNTLAYAQLLWQRMVVNKFAEELRLLHFISSNKGEILRKRLQFWQPPLTIEEISRCRGSLTFQRFDFDNVLDFYQFCDLFFNFLDNADLRKKAVGASRRYQQELAGQIRILTEGGCFFRGEPWIKRLMPGRWWYLWRRG